MEKIIYLDNGATTEVDVESFTYASEFYKENFYNPSALYKSAQRVAKKLNECKDILLKPNRNRNLIFTAGGTEADNIAIFGFGKRGNVVTTLGEHSAVYNSFQKLKEQGVEVRYANLRESGAVDVDDLLSKIDANTTFVSVVHVNNETGAINDVNDIASKVKAVAPRCVFHSDGVQAFGKIKTNLNSFVDLYSVSAHKIGGLKGVGGLIVKDTIKVPTFVFGGGQEKGVRSGTENVLGAICFAKAYENRLQRLEENFEKVLNLKKLFVDKLDKNLFKVISSENSSPYILSVSAVGLRGAVLQNMLEDDGVIIGTGSACSSKKPHSRILSAFEKSGSVLDGAIRISFSPNNTEEEVNFAVDKMNFNAAKFSGVIK